MKHRLTIPEIGDEEIAAVAAVLRSGFLVQGEQVRNFERLVAEYVGVKHAVAVSSGTAALHLALLACEIGADDEVIVPDYTFPATANVVALAGARPVLVDIDRATFNIDVTALRAAVTTRTRAIMPVHLFGQPADMGPILEIAREKQLCVIEDAACALGAEYRGRKCGCLGNVGCFSFHPRKAITTGEGGMVTTDHDDVAERVRLLRNHGMVPRNGRPCFEDIGFNYRMTDFQGALGAVQMGRLEEILKRRRRLAEVYFQELAGVRGVTLPTCLTGARHVWQSFVIRLTKPGLRDTVQQALARVGIESTIGTYAVSGQPAFEQANFWLPASRESFAQALSLPLHSRMTESDVQEISGHLAGQLTSLAA